MGLAEMLLGKTNPFAQWAGENQNLLGSIGAGLAQGPSFSQGLANGAMRAPAGRAADAANLERRRAGQQNAEQQNVTASFVGERFPDLLGALSAGAPMERVWEEIMARMSAQGGTEPTANMRDFQFAQTNPAYAAFLKPRPAGGSPYDKYGLEQPGGF